VTELMTIAFRDLDAELLIDWKSVWQHGLSPREEDNSVFRNRTLMQVSGKYLDERCESDKLDDVKRALRLLTPKSIDGQSLFKFEPVAGLSDWYLARICRPRVSQIVEPELEMSFAW